MEIFAETPRLILRELLPIDDEDMFRLDSDPDVHRYLGEKPVQTIEECRAVIKSIRQQYLMNGVGRWAVMEKSSRAFIGWAGLKLAEGPTNNHTDYYDIGYRLIKQYWGQGYATEAAMGALQYGFEYLHLSTIFGTADIRNTASLRVLKKIGLQPVETYEWNGEESVWLQITKQDWHRHAYTGLIPSKIRKA